MPCRREIGVHRKYLFAVFLRERRDPVAVIGSYLLLAALLKNICGVGIFFYPEKTLSTDNFLRPLLEYEFLKPALYKWLNVLINKGSDTVFLSLTLVVMMVVMVMMTVMMFFVLVVVVLVFFFLQLLGGVCPKSRQHRSYRN